MQAAVASAIAVLGTLLGSVTTYLLQRQSAMRAQEFTRSERMRGERLDAYATFGGALANYRRGQMDCWHAEHGERRAAESELREPIREVQRLRTAALEAMFRAELLTDSDELAGLGRGVLAAIDEVPAAKTDTELEGSRTTSRTLIYGYMAAAKHHVPSTDPRRAAGEVTAPWADGSG